MGTSTAAQLRRPDRDRHDRARGFALLMVIAVIAIASILGYVMLSTASLQNHAGSNQVKVLSADYLAESGVNIAMYYLQYPKNAPALNAQGYWAGMNGNYTLPNGSPGSLSVAVTRDPNDPWTYEVAATALVGSPDDPVHRVTRTTGARVYVRNEYIMRPGAVVANGNITLYGPITTTGDVYSSKQLAMKTGASTPVVNGRGYSQSVLLTSGYTQPTGQYWPIDNATSGAAIAPTNDSLNRYRTYSVDGETRNAGLLQSVTNILTGLLSIVFPAPSTDNPAGVIYKDASSGPLVLTDNQTINGTLIVEGDLQIKGTNITINPQPGFPALVVTGNLEIFQSGKNLVANGVTYIGGQLKSNNNGLPAPPQSLASTFTVNGGLIFGSTTISPVMLGYNAKTSLNYNATKAKAPELSSTLRQATGVTIVRWGLP